MRIAYLPDGKTVNALYRSIGPMMTLAERGHEVRELEVSDRGAWHDILRWCEVLHVHRVCDGGVVELARAAKAAGAAVVWDDDDDVTQVPRAIAAYRDVGGARGSRRRAARAKLFEEVDLVTTPSAHLAGVFREAGARRVEVIENYVIDRYIRDRAPRADGVTIGWVAAKEHRLDLDRLPIVSVLTELLAAHPEVRVTTIGLKLDIGDPRYRHVAPVPYDQLLREVSAFDIGIAPLSPDWAINHARSNVKLKEYAAMGVPWLASPIGPYVGMGAKQGGMLVGDGGWRGPIEELVVRPRSRGKLAKRAAKWGRAEGLSRNVGRWEVVVRTVVAETPARA